MKHGNGERFRESCRTLKESLHNMMATIQPAIDKSMDFSDTFRNSKEYAALRRAAIHLQAAWNETKQA